MGRKAKDLADKLPGVSRNLVEQAIDFTSPRGRLEMGGLLIGHLDSDGAIQVVTGFFPKQLEATAGYCEFSGSWVAMAAAACLYANQACSDPIIPELRIVGWIHTHPNLGLFLSSIDVATYKSLKLMTPDSKFIAVVIDPLRDEQGIFLDENSPNEYFSTSAVPEMSQQLRQKYHCFLDRMQEIKISKGSDELCAILPGDLRIERLLMGDTDDSRTASRAAIQKMKGAIWTLEEEIKTLKQKIKPLEGLNREIISMKTDSMIIQQHLLDLKSKTSQRNSFLQKLFS